MSNLPTVVLLWTSCFILFGCAFTGETATSFVPIKAFFAAFGLTGFVIALLILIANTVRK